MLYYDARAEVYDESVGFQSGTFLGSNSDASALRTLQKVLRAQSHVRSTLEIACGTGIWTRELLRTSNHVHAVDASRRMIALNRENLSAKDRVTYECADIFTWNPVLRYDRVAAFFWISHVPDELLESFVFKVGCATTQHGEVVLIDECYNSAPDAQANRTLADGRRFSIVKVFRTPEQIECAFARAHYRLHIRITVGPFFAVVLRR